MTGHRLLRPPTLQITPGFGRATYWNSRLERLRLFSSHQSNPGKNTWKTFHRWRPVSLLLQSSFWVSIPSFDLWPVHSSTRSSPSRPSRPPVQPPRSEVPCSDSAPGPYWIGTCPHPGYSPHGIWGLGFRTILRFRASRGAYRDRSKTNNSDERRFRLLLDKSQNSLLCVRTDF